MGRDKLLKVDDSVSFRAINKIIRFYGSTIDNLRGFVVGLKTSPLHQNTPLKLIMRFILSLYDKKGNSNKCDRKITIKTYPTVVRLNGR